MHGGEKNTMTRIAACTGLLLAAVSAYAQNPPPAMLWYNAGHVELNVTNLAEGGTATWQFDRADNGDIRIIKEEQRGATKVSGALLSVCDDQALLLKDIVPARRHELRELDEPVLHLQLVLRLLARALPQGPLALGAEADIDVGEQKNPLRLRKGATVRRDFLAPWRARGRVTRGTPEGIRFELAYSYAGIDADARGGEMKLGGVWQQNSRVPAFENSYAIADWKVYRIDTVVNFVGGNGQMEPLLISRPMSFKTLGELRSRIEHVWSDSPKARKQSDCKL